MFGLHWFCASVLLSTCIHLELLDPHIRRIFILRKLASIQLLRSSPKSNPQRHHSFTPRISSLKKKEGRRTNPRCSRCFEWDFWEGFICWIPQFFLSHEKKVGYLLFKHWVIPFIPRKDGQKCNFVVCVCLACWHRWHWRNVVFFGGPPSSESFRKDITLEWKKKQWEVKGSCRMGYALPKNMMILVVTVLGSFFFFTIYLTSKWRDQDWMMHRDHQRMIL